jgi:hypothetical protein
MAERLGENLLRRGIISQSQLQEALRTLQFFGGKLGSQLIQLGYLDEVELGTTLAEIHRVSYADREDLRQPPPEVLSMLPPEFVRKHRAIPFRAEKRKLHLALVNPRDALGLHEASFLTGLAVVPYVAPEIRLLEAIEKHYRLRLERRRGIRVPGGAPDPSRPPAEAPPEPRPAPPPVPPPTPGAGPTPAATPPDDDLEIGLDGRPLDEPANPEAFPAWRSGETGSAGDAETGPRRKAPPSVLAPDARGAAAAPPAPPERGSLEEAAQVIAGAAGRDEAGRVALAWLAARYRRAAIFSVHRKTAVGWQGMGPDFESDRIKRVQVDLTIPSIFSGFGDGRNVYYGPVPNLPVHQDLYTYLGGRLPASVLVVPVMLKRRVVAILYADNGSEIMPAPDLVAVRRLAAKLSLGLEALILRNKILMA